MKLVFTNILYFALFFIYNYLCVAQDDGSFGIGSFFEQDDQSKVAFDSKVEKAQIYTNENHHISDTDSFKAQKLVCNMALEHSLAAIFGPSTITTAPIVESICANTGLPNIKFSWCPSSTLTSEESSVINFYPKLSSLSHGIATLVKNLQWRSFVFLYETDEGLIQLQDILKLQTMDGSVNVIMKQLGPGPDYRPLLKEIRTSSENKIVLDCHTDNIIPILSQAKDVNLTQTLYSYFLSSLDAHTINLDALNITANITTVRIIDPTNNDFLDAFYSWKNYALINRIPFVSDPYLIKTETVLVHDAVNSFMESVAEISRDNTIETRPLNCYDVDENAEKWSFGIEITKSMRNKDTVGISGPISFDAFGQRNNFAIYLVEKNRDVILAKWNADPKRWDEIEFIRSESDRFQAQLETMRLGTIIVSSRLMAPYLMEKPPPESGERLEGNARYEGFSMDLISEISHILKFKFEFKLTEDGKYGNYDPKTKSWNGLIRDILDHKADLAICDLTITHQRREVVDFSMPFMRLGISILFKKSEEEPVNMFAFLDPFSMEVWIYTATLYLAVSVILYFVARMAPGDWENPHPCDQNPTELENIWDIKNCLWLTLGSIMTQGCDILPKGISSRLATSMWWFFSLIMTSSYTANLAAFLTMERMEPTIDSAEALSQQTKIKYGTVDGGSTQAFFRDSNYTPYARMWTNMEQDKQAFEKDNAGGVNRVLSSTKQRKYAFLMESSQIEYEVATKCELKQVGKWLDSKGYGIAMPIDYPFRSNINEAILKLQEDGKLNELKIRWWQKNRKEKLCEKPKSDEGSSELSMENVGGVFLVLGIGVGVAFILAMMEFLWNVRNVSVDQHITFLTALKLELIFAMNVWVTKKRTKPQLSESSSSSSRDSRNITPAIMREGSIGFNLNIINRTQSQESNNK